MVLLREPLNRTADRQDAVGLLVTLRFQVQPAAVRTHPASPVKCITEFSPRISHTSLTVPAESARSAEE